MKGKILISGVTGDIGVSIATFFLEQGWEVIGVSRSDKKLNICHHSFSFYSCDVTDKQSMISLIEKNSSVFNGLNIIINCAGVLGLSSFEETSIDEWYNIFNTNFLGTVYFTKLFMPFLKKQEKSSIVFIGSRWGETGHIGASAYSASKSALKGFFKSLQFDFMHSNIRPFLLSPGSVQGKMSEFVDGNAKDKYISPLSIAKQVYFLHNLPVNTVCDEIYMKAIPYDYE